MSILDVMMQERANRPSALQQAGQLLSLKDAMTTLQKKQQLQGLLAQGATPEQLVKSGFLAEGATLNNMQPKPPTPYKASQTLDDYVYANYHGLVFNQLPDSKRKEAYAGYQKQQESLRHAGAPSINIPSPASHWETVDLRKGLDEILKDDPTYKHLSSKEKALVTNNTLSEAAALQAQAKANGEILPRDVAIRRALQIVGKDIKDTTPELVKKISKTPYVGGLVDLLFGSADYTPGTENPLTGGVTVPDTSTVAAPIPDNLAQAGLTEDIVKREMDKGYTRQQVLDFYTKEYNKQAK